MRDYYANKTPAERRKIFVEGRDKERVRRDDKARYHDNPERRADVAERTKKWRQDNPKARKAQSTVANALRSGALTRGPCELKDDTCCGKMNAHHDNYDKPLEVRWLCRSHHMRHHAKHGPST